MCRYDKLRDPRKGAGYNGLPAAPIVVENLRTKTVSSLCILHPYHPQPEDSYCRTMYVNTIKISVECSCLVLCHLVSCSG